MHGRFLTGNKESVTGVSLQVRSEIRPTLGINQATIRKIATGKQTMMVTTLLLFRSSLANMVNTTIIFFSKMDFDREKYLAIPWYNQFGTDEIVPLSRRRDTTIKMDYYFASKAQLRLQLNNFTPLSTTDSFYILPALHNVGYNKRQATEPQFFVAAQTNNEKVIPIAGNQQNKISIVGKKN